MARSTISRIAGLALGLAWAFTAAAQDGTPLSQRPLDGRVVSVDPKDHSMVVDTSDRAHASAQARDRMREASASMRHQHHAAGHERRTAMSGDVERAHDVKLEMAPRATVIRDGLNVPLDQVRPGDDVRAMFLTDDPTRTHPWKVEVRSPDGREAPWGVDTGAGG